MEMKQLTSIALSSHCVRIVNEYETFKEKALKVPEDSKEMMELIDYMKEAQSTLVDELKVSVEVRREHFN